MFQSIYNQFTFLLPGVGNEIRLYTKCGTSTLPFKLKGKVHGIESEESTNKLLIYGENEFIFIEQNDVSNEQFLHP